MPQKIANRANIVSCDKKGIQVVEIELNKLHVCHGQYLMSKLNFT